MANVDVSLLMEDPDFVDPIQVISRIPFVDGLGENILTEFIQNSIGSVQPADFRTVQKLPEAMRVSNLSSFWFKGKITASAPGQYATILVFQGQRYQVLTVADWSNFGEGYCEGVCVAEVPAP